MFTTLYDKVPFCVFFLTRGCYLGTEPCCPLAEEEKGKTTEVEFLDVIRTKILRLSLYAIHSVSTDGFLKKTRFYSRIHASFPHRNNYLNCTERKKTQVCSWIALCRKVKSKVETSSLIMLRNINEIVLSWIPTQGRYCVCQREEKIIEEELSQDCVTWMKMDVGVHFHRNIL